MAFHTRPHASGTTFDRSCWRARRRTTASGRLATCSMRTSWFVLIDDSYPQESHLLELALFEGHLCAFAMTERVAPARKVAICETSYQAGFNHATVGDDQDAPAGRDRLQCANPNVPLALPHLGRRAASTDELREFDEGVRPGPALVVADLVPGRGRELAERLQLLVHGQAHGQGRLRRARDLAGEYEIERPHGLAHPPGQRDAVRRKMRAFAARLALLRAGMTADFDETHEPILGTELVRTAKRDHRRPVSGEDDQDDHVLDTAI